MKALAKNPENRYQSAQAMRDDIDRFLGGIPVTAPPVLTEAATTQLSAVTSAMPVVGDDAAPSRRRRTAQYLLLAAGVLVVVGVLGFAAFALFGADQKKISVPNVTGLTLAQAKSKLVGAGLVVDQVNPLPNDLPKNTVLSQNPPADAQVSTGTSVDLTVSSGPDQVPVPQVINFDQQTATQRILDAGLVVANIVSKNSDQPAGTVIDVKPAEGELVDTGSGVTLYVSTGKVAVPNVVGDTEAQARATLIQYGFTPQVIPQEDATATPGTVLAQSPTADTPLRLGSTVTITVATAPPASPTPSSTSPSPTPSPTVS